MNADVIPLMKRFTITHLLLSITWIAIATSWARFNWQDLPYSGRLDDGWNCSFVDVVTKKHATVDDQLIASSPSWDPRDKHPPISAKEALMAINGFRVETLTETKNWKWSLTSIGLYPLDAVNGKWCWIGLFDASVKSGGSSGPPVTYAAYVMMDGKVVGIQETDYYNFSLRRLGLLPERAANADDLDDAANTEPENAGGVF